MNPQIRSKKPIKQLTKSIQTETETENKNKKANKPDTKSF